MGSLALRPALLLFGNSRPRVTTTPLPHATGAYGQLPRQDFNPLDLLLLLRTVRSWNITFGRVMVVVYTYEGEDIRLISVRHAEPKERRSYEKGV